MKIRSVTVMFDPINTTYSLADAAATGKKSADALQKVGYELQTMRLATTPFPTWCPLNDSLIEKLADFEKKVLSHGFNYVSVGPLSAVEARSSVFIPEILAQTSGLFCTMQLLSENGRPSMKAISACAEVIKTNSSVTDDGFTNLRFAALAGVRPGSPFFPAAYNGDSSLKVHIAVESADLAISVFSSAKNLNSAEQTLIQEINRQADTIHQAIYNFMPKGQLDSGIDFTLAPHPNQERSIGTALEKLGLPGFGLAGSLAASAFLMSVLDQANPHRVGFNGLMLPILEDSILAERASEGLLTIQNLLLYSAVCGTGLDCIPLPGDISTDEIIPILMDTAALSSRLQKQLTARLMPVPGKKIGEMTTYGFEYFANSRIMDPQSKPLSGLFVQDQELPINPLKQITRSE